MICLEVALLWQKFLPDHFVCQKKCLCEKDLNIFLENYCLSAFPEGSDRLLNPYPLLKTAFPHMSRALDHERGQFTLVGLLPRFRITAKYSKLFRRSSWSQEKKEQPFTKATFSFSFFSSSSFSFFSCSLFFFLLSGFLFFSCSLSLFLSFSFSLSLPFPSPLSLSLCLSLSPSFSFSFSLYLSLFISLSLSLFIFLFLFLFPSLSHSVSLSLSLFVSLFLFLFLFLFILLYLYIYIYIFRYKILRCKSNAIKMLNPTHYKYYNVIRFNS